MTYPILSSRPTPEASPRRSGGQYTPVWILLGAIGMLFAGIFLLLSRPVGQWAAAMQPTLTPTIPPTATATATTRPTATLIPTRTPTPGPTEAKDSARPNRLFELATDLRSIQMMDARTGWGLGQNSLYRTQDGGRTWEDVTPSSAMPKERPGVGYFLNGQTAWYFVSNGVLNFSGVMFRTQDGGKSWSYSQTYFGGETPAISYLDLQRGWVLTSSYNFSRELLRTENGGLTWEPLHRVGQQLENRSGQLPDAGTLRGPVFRNETHGWMGGTTPVQAGFSFIYETQDGGRIWLLKELPMDIGYASLWISPPRFFGAERNQGVMVTYAAPLDAIVEAQGIFNENQFGVTPLDLAGARYVFFSTQDGGENWEEISYLDISNPTPFSIATQNIFIVLDGTTLHRTTNGGQTWTTVAGSLPSFITGGGDLETLVDQPESELQITGIQFVGILQGWAWGRAEERLHLYTTLNGGLIWQELDLTP